MAKVRVFSLAKELGLKSSSLIKALSHMGVQNVTSASAIDEDTAATVRELLAEQLQKARDRLREAQGDVAETPAEAQEVSEAAVEEQATVGPVEVAATAEPGKRTEAAAEPDEEDESELKQQEKELEHLQRELGGREFSPSHPGSYETIEAIEARMAEIQATHEPARDAVRPLPELARRPTGPRPASAIDVPPVVTVLGHVDHGKTSLLDALRSTNVVAGESGGITQHIGASEIERNGKTIVFIDTPGHEAFTAMRARGAQITDIAILIIAADDGVMPQTVEALNHAKAAGVPIVVAINKCDLPAANAQRVKQQLLEHELVPEEWGGDTIVCEVSAATGQGLEELVEMLLLVAEVQELWGDPQEGFVGVVIESSMAASQGAIATLLVRRGTLSVGDAIVVGTHHGRVRRLNDWRGKSIRSVDVGHPVEIVGLSGPPEAGEIAVMAASAKDARAAAEQRTLQDRDRDLETSRAAALRELFAGMRDGDVKPLNFIIKADVFGSGQALGAKFMQLDGRLDEIDIDIVHTAVGQVSESDVMLARASDAIIIAFRTDVSASAQQTAETEGVEIRRYDVIYEALDDVVAAASGLLEPVIEERVIGQAEVMQTFRSSRAGVVAGCRVTEGRLQPNAKIRVRRNGEIVYEGKLDSLRHFDNDVSEIAAPGECGVAVRNYRAWEVGDQIEAAVEVSIERRVTMAGGAERVDGRR